MYFFPPFSSSLSDICKQITTVSWEVKDDKEWGSGLPRAMEMTERTVNDCSLHAQMWLWFLGNSNSGSVH